MPDNYQFFKRIVKFPRVNAVIMRFILITLLFFPSLFIIIKSLVSWEDLTHSDQAGFAWPQADLGCLLSRCPRGRSLTVAAAQAAGVAS